MAMMIGSLCQALLDGGTSAEAARKAAEEVADRQKQPADIRTSLAVVKAPPGVLIAGVAALIIKTLLG